MKTSKCLACTPRKVDLSTKEAGKAMGGAGLRKIRNLVHDMSS